jgi:O-antigen ligase
MPRYLALAVGEGRGALTARRLSLLFLALVLVLWLLADAVKRREIYECLRQHRSLVVVVLLIVLMKLLATLAGAGTSTLLYVADDFLFSLPVLLLIVAYTRVSDARETMLALTVLGLLFSEILAILEHLLQAPLIPASAIDVPVSEKVLEGRFRDGQYRSSALFDNPLLLAEYVCIAWPFAWYFLRFGRSSLSRLAAFCALAGAPTTLYFVNARSGWLVFLLSLLATALLTVWLRARPSLKLLLVCMVGLILAASAFLTTQVFVSPEAFFGGGEAGRSALGRVAQYYAVYEAFLLKPWLGYGMRQNLADELEFIEHLDSYWLRVVLEGGLAALVLFLALLSLAVRRAYRIAAEAHDSRDRHLALAVSVSLLALGLYKLFLSIPWNNVYLFLLTGILLAWRRGSTPLPPHSSFAQPRLTAISP